MNHEVGCDRINPLDVKGFGDLGSESSGELLYHGTDKEGRKVYSIASKGSKDIITRAIKGLSKLYSLESPILINLDRFSDLYTSLGIIISRAISRKTGEKIVAWGIKRRLKELCIFISKVQEG